MESKGSQHEQRKLPHPLGNRAEQLGERDITALRPRPIFGMNPIEKFKNRIPQIIQKSAAEKRENKCQNDFQREPEIRRPLVHEKLKRGGFLPRTPSALGISNRALRVSIKGR